MRRFNRYLFGFLLGILVEYMARAEFNIFPMLISILLVFYILLDLFVPKRTKQ